MIHRIKNLMYRYFKRSRYKKREREFITLEHADGYYRCKEATNIEMEIVGSFLRIDVKRYSYSFKKWALYSEGDVCSGDSTQLEKDEERVYLNDPYSEEAFPTVASMTIKNFVQLLDEWQEKVCKKLPLEVIIIHQNDEFRIEVKK